ncbi:MAG: LolA family protein [Myxococcales bacterium]
MLTALTLALSLASPPDLHQTVERMQAFYEKTRDLRAEFAQTFVNPAFHKTLRSQGTLEFKKPGMIRFSYSQPDPKQFVVKGDRITTYVPAAQQAMVGAFHADQLSASVTFLWGKGDLEKEFDIAPADRTDLAPGVALLLTPKKPDPRFNRIYFVVDPKSHAVKESLLIDAANDENRFAFTNLRVNRGLPNSDFELTLPAGTQIVKLGESAP